MNRSQTTVAEMVKQQTFGLSILPALSIAINSRGTESEGEGDSFSRATSQEIRS